MRHRAFQNFFLGGALLLFAGLSGEADLATGQSYAVKFVDFDGRTISTADGVTSVIVLTPRADVAKARLVAARVPDFCLANPAYRMVTVVNLVPARAGRALVRLLMRHRLNTEAAQLQRRYDRKGISKDARRDVFVVADFDGTATSALGMDRAAPAFRVFVFEGDGKLRRQWRDVPDAAELAAALR